MMSVNLPPTASNVPAKAPQVTVRPGFSVEEFRRAGFDVEESERGGVFLISLFSWNGQQHFLHLTSGGGDSITVSAVTFASFDCYRDHMAIIAKSDGTLWEKIQRAPGSSIAEFGKRLL